MNEWTLISPGVNYKMITLGATRLVYDVGGISTRELPYQIFNYSH